ncbi:hypothetical protein [Roseibium sp. RKSG952]|uniref:DoxX family protein n=1 Tax=Roseibium sp. RKSG952 TaxID=2529384 RepID=UPI0012BB9427|nr:hypothetical protein [Roseibium sp. RKSG952]MTH97707.1 hypothetical protein [Roseibium sp. RKSG952]
MTTPLVILAILTLPLLGGRVLAGPDGARFGGHIGLAMAFVFFGVGHFVQTNGMIAMLPEAVPYRRELVLATGVLEFGIALGLVFRASRRAAGYAATAVLIAFFPANIHAALAYADMGGHAWGPVYLVIRAPLQILLLLWTWQFVLRRELSPALN